MNNNLLILCLTTTILIVLIDYSNTAAPEKSCKVLLGELTKRQLGGIATCTKSMTFKNGKDKAAKMNCVLKCVMMAEGLLGKDGKMTDESFDAFLEKEVPPSMMENVKPILGNCKDTVGRALDPDEEFCKSYDPFIKCLMGAIGAMCPK